MVALGMPTESGMDTVLPTYDGHGSSVDKVPCEGDDSGGDTVVSQEPPLSTTTVTSSTAASLSSADDDGDSEDADNEDSDDDQMYILSSSSENEADNQANAGAPEEVEEEAEEEERNSTDVDPDEEETPLALPSPPSTRSSGSNSRFSLISIPRRVRASVFSRKPKDAVAGVVVKETTEVDHTSSSDEKTTVSTERGSTLCTISPTSSSTYAGLLLPSLTSFASLTRSLSQMSDDKHGLHSAVENDETFKSFWDEKLRATMDRIAHRARTDTGAAVFERQGSQLDVFHLLLKLYAHQDVIEELYASYHANVPEFEFYIPQLCTFLLHGNYAKQHQLECFLMSRSGESLVFAHRLGWFLKSFTSGARGYQSEYLSVTSSPEDENSDLLTAIQHRGGVPAVLMEQGLNIEEVAEPGPNLMLRRASAFSIDGAAQETNSDVGEEDDETFALFLKTKRTKLMYEAMPEEGNEQQIALYNETPAFVTELTDLADRLILVQPSQRNDELGRGLSDISEKSLPSNVIYLPIGNTCHRVQGFRIEECFTFSTKERVPYFLCVEVIDYSAPASDDTNKKVKRPPLARRRSRTRKFGIKLPFKKAAREPEIPAGGLPEPKGFGFERRLVPSSNTSLREAQELLDGLIHGETSPLPHDLYYEEETKSNDDRPMNYDLLDKNVIAVTPDRELSDADVADRLCVDEEREENDGDDEKENEWQNPSDTEKKKRLGQWGLPRARRRSSEQPMRPDGPKTTSKFDAFYTAWFAKKQNKPLSSLPELSPAEVEPSLTECAIITPQIGSPPEDNQHEEPAVAATATASEPAPEPKEEIVQEGYDDSSDDGHPKRRGRDMSVSLDFTDSDVWKHNFELDDMLTDAEPDAPVDAETPKLPLSEDSHAVLSGEECAEEEDDEEYEDEKPIIVFRERWSDKEERIRKESPLGSHPGWRLLPVIVKSNDDLRQEQFAAQLIAQCDRIFKGYSLPLRLRPYNVIATSANAGLIEAVPNTVSLDSLRRNDPDYTTLLDFFQRLFGNDTSEFREARRNFVESLAAYSILCYVFQIKDRHNGNILLDTDGHVIHIDFGFLLTNSPGSNLNFERAPFKLTDEFVELMGGPRSATFRYFRSLCIRAYLALRRNMDKIVLLVEMMLVGNQDLPCFASGKRVVIDGLKERLKPGARTSECQVFVNQLIDRSINNWRTRWYDKYQRAWVGIL